MKTKIIATIGPKSESYEKLTELAKAGMNIARMNFSHCTYEEYKTRKENITKINKELGTDIKILQDLQGPRIRVGKLPEEGIKMIEDEEVVFTTKKDDNEDYIFIDHAGLNEDVKVGEPLYLANGDITLTVTKVETETIKAKVNHGGILYSRKAVNVPHTKLKLSGLTPKDIKDAEFGLKEGVDYMAISFVQDAKDIKELKDITKDKVKIIAKIETKLSLDNIDEIIKVSDAIMVARGDLGIEMPSKELPFIQKHLINHAIWHNTPSITATQMMLSMVENNKPTRAEVSDVANAVSDGTSAVMLSDETASGNYPVESVKIMAEIVEHAEEFILNKGGEL